MCAISSAEARREQVGKPPKPGALPARSRMVLVGAGPDLAEGTQYSRVDLGDSARLALMITPGRQGVFRDQAREVAAAIRAVLAGQPELMTVTGLTVFLKNLRDQPACEQVLADFFGSELPVTNFVLQPPCNGAAVAIEAWAVGGRSVRVERFGPRALAVGYDSVRWVHCGGVMPAPSLRGVYAQTLDVLEQSQAVLVQAGSSFRRLVRTWFYLGGITRPEAKVERYQELNRARTDFYHGICFHSSSLDPNAAHGVYPASTGIGMAGRGLVMSCLALETGRKDVFLMALENPQQTPAYAYDAKYCSASPKFSRAVALLLGDYLTTWVSGTASIVESETRYPGDPEKQTEQTIDNIERLIGAENFSRHGLKGAGAKLHDLAKIRVYLKRPQDLPKCQAVCQSRFGAVPTIFAVADICRPDLLVEIEGVAFSRYPRPEIVPAPTSPAPSIPPRG